LILNRNFNTIIILYSTDLFQITYRFLLKHSLLDLFLIIPIKALKRNMFQKGLFFLIFFDKMLVFVYEMINFMD